MADERTSQPQSTDEPEVEGHGFQRKWATPETDQDDVEGHGIRANATGQPQPGDEPEAEGQ